MKNNNIPQITNVILLSAIGVLLSITSIMIVIENVQAITTTLSSVIPGDDNKTTIMSNNNNNATTSLGLIAASPFYEANVGKIIGQRIVSTGDGTTPEVEQSILENGTIKGVGNVTSLGTWTNTFRSPGISYGVGQGVITTTDGRDMATWTAYDIGRSNTDGVIIYHGISFFNTNPTGKLAFLKNLEALHTTEVDGNKQTTKMWEWK
jgi:hypothetical protein